jgi:hypothetical protein
LQLGDQTCGSVLAWMKLPHSPYFHSQNSHYLTDVSSGV